jgi:hypothetical protein
VSRQDVEPAGDSAVGVRANASHDHVRADDSRHNSAVAIRTRAHPSATRPPMELGRPAGTGRIPRSPRCVHRSGQGERNSTERGRKSRQRCSESRRRCCTHREFGRDLLFSDRQLAVADNSLGGLCGHGCDQAWARLVAFNSRDTLIDCRQCTGRSYLSRLSYRLLLATSGRTWAAIVIVRITVGFPRSGSR